MAWVQPRCVGLFNLKSRTQRLLGQLVKLPPANLFGPASSDMSAEAAIRCCFVHRSGISLRKQLHSGWGRCAATFDAGG
jgi:hypothetical protein